MAKLPIIKRLASEDFPTQLSWIGTLLYPVNLILTSLYQALNNGITLADNAYAQVVTVPVSGASPSVSFPYKFSPLTPIGMVIANVVQTNSPAVTLTVAVGCLWTQNTGVLTATIQGLDSGSTYNITFVVFGG